MLILTVTKSLIRILLITVEDDHTVIVKFKSRRNRFSRDHKVKETTHDPLKFRFSGLVP